MRVALVHPKFERSGGAERYALALAEGLAARGHEVHLFGRRGTAVPAGCRFHRVGALPLGRAVKTWTFCRAVDAAVRSSPFDVVQGFGKTTCQSVHRTGGGLHRAYREGQGAGSWTLYDRVAAGIEDRLFASPRLAAVICPSRWVAREVERFYPGVEAKVRRIANGVDTARFHPEGRGEDRRAFLERLGPGVDAEGPLLLFAATNFRLKGLSKALEALALLPAARLAVAGGDDPAAFRRDVERLGVGDRLHFLGAVEDLAPAYRAADLLIHPTRYDPFANVCLEALACGTPVLTTEENGAADVLETGDAGAVLPAGAPGEAYAAAARSLLAGGPQGRDRARRVALANDQAKHVERVLQVYEETAARRQGGV